MVSRVIVNKLQENFIENAAAVFVANIFLAEFLPRAELKYWKRRER
jgi:hypothetical protein